MVDRVEPEPKATDDRAPLYAVAYQESLRGLTQQAGVLDGARTRAGLLITAANVVTALLAGPAIKDRPGLGLGGWLAILAFIISMSLALYVIWPRRGWNFAFDAKAIIGMIDEPEKYSIATLHRRLAQLNEESWTTNAAMLDRIFEAFKWGCILLSVEVVLWVLVVAKTSIGGVFL
jgi:hypothetical protein